MTDTNTLAPCPMCGVTEGQNGLWLNSDAHYVSCQNCGVSSGDFDTDAQAVEQWNRRAPAPVSEPFAYEFSRSNGDGTHSEHIERGRLQEVAPGRWEHSGPPMGALVDKPIKPLYTAPPSQPPAQAQVDAPDMFWDADDTENFAHEIQDIVDGYGPGEIVTIECAKRMPNLRVLITGEGDGLSYEHIDAASAAQQGGKA